MEFLRFEIARRLRQPMVWIFFGVNFLLILGALNSDSIQVGGSLPSVNANAPWVAQNMVMVMTLIGLLVTTAFMNTAAVRDFADDFDQILFTKPISKVGYLAGRFFGAVLMASVPLLGVLLAVWVTGLDPFGTAGDVGPTYWGAYLFSVLLFILPNTLFAGAITFSVAALTRSQVAGFVAALGLLVAYLISGNLLDDLDSEATAALLDPLGFGAFQYETKYWTAVERNTQYLTFSAGVLALNRLIWTAVSLVVFGGTVAAWKYSKAGKKSTKSAKKTPAQDTPALQPLRLSASSAISPPAGGTPALPALFHAVKTETRAVLTSRVFLVIMAFSVANMLGSILYVDESYGTGNYPVTYLMIDAIRGSLYLFLGAIVMYYAGELVWRERDAHMAELIDAAPVASWVAPAAKFLALILVPLIVLTFAIALGVTVQTIKGYTDYDLSQYFTELLLVDWGVFVAFAALALLLQAVFDNKYIGYFAFLVFLMVATFGADAMGLTNNLFVFGSTPSVTYTAFNGMQPYTAGAAAFTVYWWVASLLLVGVAALWWVRGRGHTWRNRAGLVAQRFDDGLRFYSIGLAAALLALGGYLYYETAVVNTYLDDDATELLQVEYERRYRRFAERPHPILTTADYDIDLYPAERRIHSTATLTLQNQSDAALDSVLLVLPEGYTMDVDMPGGSVAIEDTAHQVLVYVLAQPWRPGETRTLTATSRYHARGIENEVFNTDIVPNGTFVNNSALAPNIGYQPGLELSDEDDREEYGLAAKPRATPLPDAGAACGKTCDRHYIANDAHWVELSATVTTDVDQIAVAPGKLISETTDEATGRRTFRYETEAPVIHFFSVVSGRFTVERAEGPGGVDIEIYYLPEHDYNLERMVDAVDASLSYYTREFGPYPHSYARIIEFPRYASFAQAFPGTMPASEGIGFIYDLRDSTDVDFLSFAIAHEMAHQWWAHRVVGADVQGSTMLSETFSQYGALMVGKQRFGADMMRKALKYERDGYLRARGGESRAERPLTRVEDQAYIHYRKGAVVMYALQDYLGEDTLNAVMRDFHDEYAGQGPPYPTTHDFLRHLRPRVPDSLSYIVDEWLDDIVLYDNRVTEAEAGEDGTVRFTVQVAKIRADSLGTETPLPIRGDYIDVGVYAEAGEGELLGEELWRERVRFDAAGERSFEVQVNGEADVVAIDPDGLLLDRVAEDNTEGVD